MGATSYTVYSAGTNMNDAYMDAKSAAIAEFGNQSYSGTIGTSWGVFQAQHNPVTLAEANAVAERAANEPGQEKGGPAAAIPVCNPANTKTRTKTVTMTLTDFYRPEYADVAAAVGLKAGEVLHSWRQVGPSKSKTAVTKTAAAGPTKKVYVVVNAFGRSIPSGEFTTAAKAAAAGVAYAKMNPGRYEVRAQLVSASGDALVSIVSEEISRTQQVEVTIGAAGDGKIVGWLFHGLAPS